MRIEHLNLHWNGYRLCAYCRSAIDDRLPFCPHCGAPSFEVAPVVINAKPEDYKITFIYDIDKGAYLFQLYLHDEYQGDVMVSEWDIMDNHLTKENMKKYVINKINAGK